MEPWISDPQITHASTLGVVVDEALDSRPPLLCRAVEVGYGFSPIGFKLELEKLELELS